MAVIQISKIQVRRGLQEDLPQLSGGEFGWSVDERRLFIGNGTLAEGAPLIGRTEILTQNSDVVNAISYYFRGDESGYESQTGPTASTDVIRTIQHKVDEQISVRDFGVIGDGITDNSVAFQRAINEIYPLTTRDTTISVRRILHIPAGTYVITTPLIVPSYANLQGDGLGSTIIRQDGAVDCIVKLCDSLGQVDSNLGNTAAELPKQISFSDLTLSASTDITCIVVDSATNIRFNRVKFKGDVLYPTTVGNSTSGVRLLDTAGPTSQISINQCEFTYSTYGIDAAGEVHNVVANECSFLSLYQGVSLVDNTDNPRIKVISSVFDIIAKEAIKSFNDSSVISAYNYFKGVGYGNAISMSSATVSSAVISWNSPTNYSIGDTFDRTGADIDIYPPVLHTSTSTGNKLQYSSSGSLSSFPGGLITLTDNTTANLNVLLTSILPVAIIDYSISRGTSKRVGTLKVTHNNGGSIVCEDDYSETANVKVFLTFLGNTSANSAVLNCTTVSDSSTNATLKYALRSFI